MQALDDIYLTSGVIITFGGLGVWWLFDMILILTGKFQDNKKEKIKNINPKLSWSIFVIIFVIGLASGGGGNDDEVTDVDFEEVKDDK